MGKHRRTIERLVMENRGLACKLAREFPSHIEVEDRIQAAFFGMVQAAHRFDPSHGVKFISYAHHWIRKELLMLHRRDLPVHLPGSAYRKGVRVAPAERLDDFVHDDDKKRKVDFLVDERPLPDRDHGDYLLRKQIRMRLDMTEQLIIMRRFGLLDGNEWKLREVGAYLGLSRERVRQIQNVALKKLRRAV